jgi:uncharacterized membrane protein HdeD (DUF308 family)
MTEAAASLETRDRPWWLLLLEGIIVFVIGAVLLWAPAKAKVDVYSVLVVLLGVYWLVSGVLTLVSMFIDHSAW